MKALRKVWDWMGDKRLSLVVSGALMPMAVVDVALERYWSAALDLVIIIVGLLNWPDLQPVRRLVDGEGSGDHD